MVGKFLCPFLVFFFKGFNDLNNLTLIFQRNRTSIVIIVLLFMLIIFIFSFNACIVYGKSESEIKVIYSKSTFPQTFSLF